MNDGVLRCGVCVTWGLGEQAGDLDEVGAIGVNHAVPPVSLHHLPR